MNIDPTTTLNGREPKAFNVTGAKISALQKRLRSISRSRRETLVKRSEQVERMLSQLVSEASNSQSLVESFTKSTEADLGSSATGALFGSSSLFADLPNAKPEHGYGHDLEETKSLSNVEFDRLRLTSTVRKPYSDDVYVLHSQLDFLNQEIESAMLLVEQSRQSESDTKAQLEVLRAQLLEARHDTVELRIQAAESIRTSTGNDHRQSRTTSTFEIPQGSTWEEQKLALLRAFEMESEAIGLSTMSASELESLFATTKKEIADRDLQIQELKEMLDMQSRVTADGFAMGASAVSQILDTDPFIQEERTRLKQLQDELQQKLRDAEIEISVERARIARDRLSLQNASQTFAEESSAASATNAATLEAQLSNSNPSIERKLVPGSIPRTRRWLQRLGLRDDE
jgi:hypothetical protein